MKNPKFSTGNLLNNIFFMLDFIEFYTVSTEFSTIKVKLQ